MLSNKEIATRVIEVIEDKSKWTKSTFARDAKGLPVSFNDPNAIQWCALGCVYNILEGNAYTIDEFSSNFNKQFGKSITHVNDNDGRETVISCLERMT